MSIEEFVTELKLTVDKLNPEIEHKKELRLSTPFFSGLFCPITYLYYTREQKYLSLTSYVKAGTSLGLFIKDIEIIVITSDGCNTQHKNYSPELRQQLLDSLGITSHKLK